MMNDKKEIVGANLGGPERKYRFVLMTAYDGMRIYHSYLAVLFSQLAKFNQFFKQAEQDEAGEDDEIRFDVAGCLKFLAEILPWDKVEELSKVMLPFCEIEIDGVTHQNDDATGLGEYFQGKPREVYIALFYAMCANFEDDLSPFLEALEGLRGGSDSTP